ncbi:MAG TPA: DNA polymerase I [Phycisphaerales bacterium]|nr:DNA polymerase I [Phycisphaerales bacterium]
MPATPTKTLYIIDGYAQFFRAYHAIRTPMTSPVTKEPTNMTFGFIGMLFKLLKAEGPNISRAGKPDYIVLALDVGGDKETFRSELYPEYKATRKEPPDDLKPQVNRCLDLLKEIGVPFVGAPGFEADDVIGAMVCQYREKHPDLRIRIVAKDKDLKQLLDIPAPGEEPRVEMFDVHTDTPFDAAKLMEETGLRPDQVVDMLTLMGDNVDNIPGVEGVGEKTAAQLIKEYGSLDNLLAKAAEIKGKRGEKLREAAPTLPLTKTLVTLRCDIPVPLSLDEAKVENLRLDRMLPILKELGFNRYQDELKAMLGVKPDAGTEPSSAKSRIGGDADSRTKPESVLFMPGPNNPAPPRKPRPTNDDPFQHGLFTADKPAELKQAQSGEYTCIKTKDDLAQLVKDLQHAPIISLDTETTSLCPHDCKLCGISLSTREGTGVYIPTRSPASSEHLDADTVIAALKPILEDPTKPKCGHNLKFDIQVLRAHAVTLRGIAFDSMVASYLIDASRSSHGLDSLALALLGRTNISLSDLIGSGKNMRCFDTVPIDQATCYAAEDADVALQLHNVMLPQLEEMNLMPLFEGVEMPLVEVLAELEWNGILVAPAELDRQRVRLQGQIELLLKQIKDESLARIHRTFDPNSPSQLASALFNKPTDEPPGMGLKSVRKTKTGHSTDVEVLEKLALEEETSGAIPRLILEYRQLTKLVSTYLVALKEAIHKDTKRIHTSFNQTVAATGRLASSDPNLQNIPIRTEVGREIRKSFIAPPGKVLVTADYSQIELRLLAHLSRDPALIDAFHHGADIHTAVAAQIHNTTPDKVTKDQRNGAKMVNFGIVYGITAFGLARRLKVSEREAATIIDGYKRRFSGITTFLQECIDQARTNGYVETMLKRRRPIPDVDSNQPARRALAERLAINSVVQGSAADLIKLAMVNIHKEMQGGSGMPEVGINPASDSDFRLPTSDFKMLLQIHDELVFESPESIANDVKAFVTTRMEQAMQLSVPLKADAYIARNWFEGK